MMKANTSWTDAVIESFEDLTPTVREFRIRPTGDAARIDTGAKVAFDATKLMFANFSGEWSSSGASYSAAAGFKFTR